MDVKLKKSVFDKPTGDEKLKSISDKVVLTKPKKKNDYENKTSKNARFLITVNVLGSSGPIRFVVKENDSVSRVIDAALKLYGREKRLPVLGSDVDNFLLYPANAGLDALSPSETIGSQGLRNFVLCKKAKLPHMTEARSEIVSRKRSGSSWKAWINKSLSFKIFPTNHSHISLIEKKDLK